MYMYEMLFILSQKFLKLCLFGFLFYKATSKWLSVLFLSIYKVFVTRIVYDLNSEQYREFIKLELKITVLKVVF